MSAPATLPIDARRIVAAIEAAELRTSGEIRVVIAKRPAEDAVAAAKQEFERLGMTRTAARNGVLIFVAPKSHTFAVVGDTGIHERCGEGFWSELAQHLTEHFKRAEFTAGLIQAVERAGALLATHFPRQPDDRNELSNDIEHA